MQATNAPLSRSYFWDCVTFNEDCPFLASNSKLLSLGIALVGLYSAFILTILADLKFYWSLEQLQNQIDSCVNFVMKKVNYLQMNKQRLVSTKERFVKQLQRSEECARVVNLLRADIAADASGIGFLAIDRENTEFEDTPLRSDMWRERRLNGDFST